MKKTANKLIDAAKPAWTQYKNAWSTAPRMTGAKQLAGLGLFGGLFGLGYSANSENIRKAQEERPASVVHWGKPNPKEDWLNRSANFVRKYNPFVALTADRALSHNTPNKVDYDKQGWFTKNFPGTSEFLGAYDRQLNGWGTMLERGGRIAVADFGKGYSAVGYSLPALLSGGVHVVGKLSGNKSLSSYGDKLLSWVLDNYRNDYNNWEDFADNSYSKDNYSGVAPEVYQSFRSLEQPAATAINVGVTGAALKLPGKVGTLTSTANTLDDYGSLVGIGLSSADDNAR